MRLPERYKKTFYVTSETYFGSGVFNEPFKMRGLATPKSDYILYGGGITIQQNSIELKFESNVKGIDDITQNSRIWINRTPDPEQFGEDYTHVVKSRDTTTNQWFVTITCDSATGDFPLLEED